MKAQPGGQAVLAMADQLYAERRFTSEEEQNEDKQFRLERFGRVLPG